eukprot:scaffold29081_cov94-Isochrysis_galbana.AAC.2
MLPMPHLLVLFQLLPPALAVQMCSVAGCFDPTLAPLLSVAVAPEDGHVPAAGRTERPKLPP